MTRVHRHEQNICLGIRIDGYDVAIGKSMNLNLIGDLAHYLDDDEPVFTAGIRFDVIGTSICPEPRANEKYEITIYGEELGPTEPKIRDIISRDQDSLPIYRIKRGRQIPVYSRPAGIATLKKNRQIEAWQACIWISIRSASDLLVLLTQSASRPLYVMMYEHTHERRRWIQSLNIQTGSPAAEA